MRKHTKIRVLQFILKNSIFPYQERWRDWPYDTRQPLFSRMVLNPEDKVEICGRKLFPIRGKSFFIFHQERRNRSCHSKTQNNHCILF